MEKNKNVVSDEDMKLLSDIKNTISKRTDVIVKQDRDGKFAVYKNNISKVS